MSVNARRTCPALGAETAASPATPDCIYHVTSRGTCELRSTRSDDGQARFLRFVDRACGRRRADLPCLLPDGEPLPPARRDAAGEHGRGDASNQLAAYAKQFNLQHESRATVRAPLPVVGHARRDARDGRRSVHRSQSGAGGHLCDSRGLAMVEPCSDGWACASPAVPDGRTRCTAGSARRPRGGDELSGVRGRWRRRASSSDPTLEKLIDRGTLDEDRDGERSVRILAAGDRRTRRPSAATLSRRLRAGGETLASGSRCFRLGGY